MEQGTVGQLYREVVDAPASLKRFMQTSVGRAPRRPIFVGAGDSYAAALAGFYASGGRALVFDPYTLASSPSLAKGAEVYFVSASGSTASNVAAARRVAGLANGTTAITAVARSKLAAETDNVIILPMSYEPKTPGLLSFCLSLLVVLKLTRRRATCDFHRAMKAAEGASGSISFARGTTYFLGNFLAHPAAIYAAAKSHEILGVKAQAEILEEFGHMELLALSKRDSVNAFGSFDPENLSERLSGILREQGYDSHVIPRRGRTAIECLFSGVFALQLAVLKEAKSRGMKRPSFLDIGGLLRASDALIY